MTHSTVMYIITFENKFYNAFYLNLFEKYTQAYDIFLLKMKTRFYIMMTRKYVKFVFTFIDMYLHILRHFFSMILRMTQRHAYMSHKLRTHYVCVWCQISVKQTFNRWQIIKVHETIQTSLYWLFLMDRSKWTDNVFVFRGFFSLSIFGVWIWIWWSDHVSITCRVHPGQTFKCSDRFRLSSSLSIRILRSSALSRVLSDSRWRTLCNKHTKTQTSERTRFFYNDFSTYINNLNNLYLLDSIS